MFELFSGPSRSDDVTVAVPCDALRRVATFENDAGAGQPPAVSIVATRRTSRDASRTVG